MEDRNTSGEWLNFSRCFVCELHLCVNFDCELLKNLKVSGTLII